MRTKFLAALLFVALLALSLTLPEVIVALTGYDSWESFLDGRSRRLFVGALSKTDKTIDVQLEPLAEFDFKSKSEILETRRIIAARNPELTGGEYAPSEAVFGQVADSSPWWGMHGIYFFGPGSKSIEGPSEESRFLLNPLLLVGLQENRAWMTSFEPGASQNYYPRPESLSYVPSKSRVEVRYLVSGYLDHLERNRYSTFEKRIVSFSAYNARDFGYNFLYVNPKETSGIILNADNNAPLQIQHFLHKGSSCGYSGGCNNMSPYQKGMEVSVAVLPAVITLKLWRVRPPSGESDADLNYKISLK